MSCLIITPEISELAKKFPDETEESIKNLVGMWQTDNNKSKEEYPDGTTLNQYIKKVRGTDSPKISAGQTIQTYKGKWTRDSVTSDPTTLYIFTDNTDRDSGSGNVLEDSWYAQTYGEGHHYPTSTTAVIRGLDNARPISTVKWFYKNHKGVTHPRYDRISKALWHDSDFDEFKEVVDKEFQDIIDAWNTGSYTRIVFPGGDGLFNASISNITKERTPLIYEYLQGKVEELKQAVLGEDYVPQAEGEVVGEGEYNEMDTPSISTAEDQRKVDLEFDPITRRDRVTLISRFFSNEVTRLMDEITSKLQSRIESATGTLKAELEQDLREMNRFKVIESETPYGIFKRVADIFRDYVNDTEEGRIQAELNIINSNEWAGDYSDEEKLEAAKNKAAYKLQEYQKVLRNFKALAEETSSILLVTEGLRIDPNYVAPADANLNDDTPEGESNGDLNAEDWTIEEAVKDGWMTNVRQVSAYESLSQAVRAAIRQVPKLDSEGYIDEDDLGFERYLDADYVHATLLDKLRSMYDSDDMLPLLRDLERNKPWVGQVVELLENDETLFSQFYQDFMKDFVPYWIQKKRMAPDGTFKIETIALNKPEGIYYLLDAWRDNYESGYQLDKDSIYEKNGDINRENAKKGLDLEIKLYNEFSNLDTNQRLERLNDPGVWNNIMKMLHMIGIDANPATLRLALTDIKSVPGIDITDPIMLLLPYLNIIFDGAADGKVKSETRVDGSVKNGDLINTFGTAYNSIAKMIADVSEDAIESSVRENDKSHYSHVTPNYLGKLIKKLKNVNPNKALTEEDKAKGYKNYLEKFIQEEFGQYEWFFKDGHWRSDWIEKLATDKKYREALNHKVLLNHDKIDYSDWDSLDYSIVLLNEYWAEPKEGMAWYHVPILSDSPSAEFIRFVRYTTGSELDDDGNKVHYTETILDKLVDLVNQEYDRIQVVRARDELYRSGVNIQPIANYDISRDTKGNIKSLGGAEFKFLPALNSIAYEDGETFLNKIDKLKKAGSGEDLREFIKDTLYDVIEEQFEETYRKWDKIGLLEELPNGKYKNIPFTGQSSKNLQTFNALQRAKEVLGTLFNSDMDTLMRNYRDNKPVIDKDAEELFDTIKTLLSDKVSTGDIQASEYDAISRNLAVRNNAKEALREYFWNSKHATSQIIQMTTTDLAFYKNMEDFQKRFKEIHAPALRLNTKATWKGERVGRDWERTIYLKDQEIVSSAMDDIREVLDEKVKRGELSATSRDYILEQFKDVNVADAQAYRSLSSYRAIMVMSGQWNEAMENAYNHFLEGTWNIEDFSVIWQTKKPYVYTQINNDSGVEGHTGIKTPVQHKNSEFLLLAAQAIVAGPLGQSGKLRAINDFMERNAIDVVQFESTTKVGKQGVIDINDLDSYQDVIDKLSMDTGIKDAKSSSSVKAMSILENPNVVHKVSYEDYGIQTATPEHAIDAVQLVGTQIRKLITADISDDPNLRIEVNGKKLTKQQWLDLYNAINTENIIEKFSEVDEIFKDPKKIEKALLDEIRGNSRYGQDMIRACTLDKNGNFTIPLFDPVQSQRVQTLLNSIIKSRITKQKIKGGALIQVSAYGLSDSLKIVWEGSGPTKRIKYMECYMPAYSRDFYEPLMDPKTHQLDINRKDKDGKFIFPEELRKLIGYRVPTEDKYSMAPLYIKGFLPQQNGSAIMLPAEITKLSGSDFDVDKMYIMLPEFRVVKYDYAKAKYYYAKEQTALDVTSNLLNQMRGANGNETLTDIVDSIADEDQDLQSWIEQSIAEGDPYGLKLERPIIKKVRYKQDKAAHENSREARNNMLIDMMWGVLTNPDTAPKMVNPGGFDEQKRTARIINILTNMSEEDLREELTNARVQFNKNIRNSPAPLVSYLFNLPLKTLSKITDKLQSSIDPLSPMTQLTFHQQNMTGAKLIGIYANHNANHALMQHTQLGLDSENGSFKLNGKRLTSLHAIQNANKEYISRLNAGFLAASVDNVKDPVLAWLNQNTFTADASMLLSRLGYNSLEIGLLMNQPIIMEITQAFFREGRSGKGKDTIIDSILDDYKEKAEVTTDLTYDSYKNQQFYIEDLAESIIISKDMDGVDTRHTSDFRKVEFYSKQLAVGYLFKRIMSSADALGKLVQATRSDTQGGAAGPTIADTVIKIQKVVDFIEDSTKPKFPLINSKVITDMILTNEDINSVREKLLNSPLPFLQAFYTLGIRQTEKMLNKYFPQYSLPFQDVIDSLRQMTKRGKLDVKTMNNIYNDLLAYIMSKNEFFGAGVGNDNKPISSADRRSKFINDFPAYFKSIVSSNEDIAELEFIKRLKVIRANDRNPVDTIVFKNVGQLSNVLRERYMRDWTSLLYMENPKAQELALNLFRYSYYRNGFAFGPNTFIHLAPTALRLAIPDYVSTLREILISDDDLSQFVDQYILNHLDNRKLVPEIPEESTVEFTNKDKDPYDEVTFTINERSPYADKKVVRDKTEIEGEIIYDFFKYIGRRVGNKYVYYKLVEDLTLDSNVAVYRRVAPLGFKSSFIEYEYGKNAEEITSVIKQNSLSYDPLADVVARPDTEPEIDYDSAPTYDEAYVAGLMSDLFQQEFGAPMNDAGSTSDKTDLSTITPNTEFQDANDQEMCPTLYTL